MGYFFLYTHSMISGPALFFLSFCLYPGSLPFFHPDFNGRFGTRNPGINSIELLSASIVNQYKLAALGTGADNVLPCNLDIFVARNYFLLHFFPFSVDS